MSDSGGNYKPLNRRRAASGIGPGTCFVILVLIAAGIVLGVVLSPRHHSSVQTPLATCPVNTTWNQTLQDCVCGTVHGQCTTGGDGCECICDTGFEFDSNVTFICQDVDECSLSTDNCNDSVSANVTCVNTPGSWICACPDEGFVWSDELMECVNMTCPDGLVWSDELMECVNITCPDGLVWSEEAMECVNMTCPDGLVWSEEAMECVNQTCPDGFVWSDELMDCVNTTCPDGFIFSNDTAECVAENGTLACELVHPCPVGVPCDFDPDTNTFTCMCPEGFEAVSWNATWITCEDINECLDLNLTLSVCGNHSDCLNTNGGFECSCTMGYEPDINDMCVDENECLDTLDHCGAHANCTNLPGNFSCSCLDGYEMMIMNDTFSHCEDINECQDETNNTCINGNATACINTDGSFMCVCPEGYEWSDTELLCFLVIECTHAIDCGPHAVCVPAGNGTVCGCDTGYQLNNDTMLCEDINECDNATACPYVHSLCQNFPGGYHCHCQHGYSGDTCADFNACHAHVNPCELHASCVEGLNNTLDCQCNTGYHNNTIVPGQGCLDDDECGSGTHDCATFATCTNVQGSFTCSCIEGFVGDGVTCSALPS